KMREVGFPKYTDEEMKFAKEMAKSISQEEKIESLRQSKRPNWEELKDVLLDQTISEPWDEGIVWPGSTDVADVSWVVPTMEFYTTSMLLGDAGHSWQFVSMSGMSIGHKSLVFAAKTIASAGLDLLTKPGLLKQVQDDFDKRRAGRKYKCPIHKDVKPPLKVAEESAKSAPSQT
ncbi:MAG: amidohydrolase, partial [Candidatus Thorarchaeota archaeon]